MDKLLADMRRLAQQPYYRPFTVGPDGIRSVQKKRVGEQTPIDLSRLPDDCIRLIAMYLQTPAAAAVSECVFMFHAAMPDRETNLFRNSQRAYLLASRWDKHGARRNGIYCHSGFFGKVYELHENQFTQACCNKRAFLIGELAKNNETIVKRGKTRNLYARWLASPLVSISGGNF
jgi:hypothetical protein